jgi:hypothetical protein
VVDIVILFPFQAEEVFIRNRLFALWESSELPKPLSSIACAIVRLGTILCSVSPLCTVLNTVNKFSIIHDTPPYKYTFHISALSPFRYKNKLGTKDILNKYTKLI